MTFAKLLHADSIRLLRLESGSPRDELRGELITARLSENPAFEAISYRYSDPDKKHPQALLCGTQNLYIGDNLAKALRQFRYVANTRIIWVDQLCVKQDDKDERFQQLQIFGDIFSKATKVLIWLGEGDSESERAISRFKEVVQRLRQHDEQGQQDETDPEQVISSQGSNSQDIRNLFARDWFSRVWTLQEAALAEQAEVWCGNTMLLFDQFLYFFERADNDSRGHWANALSNIDEVLAGDDPDNPKRNSFQAISTVSKLKKANDMSSVRILNIMRPLDCKEQVDRIWSVLRFLPKDLVSALRPHRGTTDITELYCTLAKNGLEHRELDYLGAAGLTLHRLSYQASESDNVAKTGTSNKPENARPTLTLPSWVPDWTFTVRVHALWVLSNDCQQKRGRPLYTAGGCLSESHHLLFYDDHKHLQIQAKILDDKVGNLAEPFKIPLLPKGIQARPDVGNFVNDQFQKLDVQMQTCFNMASQCTVETSYTDVELACRSTLVGSMVSDGANSTAAGVFIRASDAQVDFMFDTYNFTRRLMQQLLTKQTPAEQMATILGLSAEDRAHFQRMSQGAPVCDGVTIKPTYVMSAFAEMCKARRFFITNTKRYMGIAPDIVQREDRICVIPGCCAPFIIRPVGQHWQLVGECYVHGIMDGEIMEDEKIPLVPIILE